MKTARIFNDEGEEVSFEVMAEDIAKVSMAMDRIKKSRLTRKLIVALIHDDTKMGKSHIETVLDSLELLGSRYLKPPVKKEAKT